MLFPGMPRPGKVFDINTLPHVVNNIHLNQVGSFPSGHTMTAFAGAFAITIVLKEKHWGLIAFIMAFFVGISRIYLCQHFFMDIF